MEPLRLMASFLTVARADSFSQAALEMQLTPQAVSAQMAQLEQWLGVRLFHRSTRRLALTDEGRLFLERCQGGFQLIEQAEQALRARRDDAQGPVRVVASPSLGEVLVAPLLARLGLAHPGLQIELVLQHRFPDVVDQGLDVGVVGGDLPGQSLVARRAGRFAHVLCAAPSYLQQHGTPTQADDLARHRCIGLRHPRSGRVWPWTFQKGGRILAIEPPLALLTQEPSVQRIWALQGAGIAQIADYFARPHLASGALVELPLPYAAPRIDVHVFMPQREHLPKRVRLVSDGLFEGLREALKRAG